MGDVLMPNQPIKILRGNHRISYKFRGSSKYQNAGKNVSVKKTTFFQSADNDQR
jgi:hypothetical protein